jgi:hypothetical protein
LSADQLAMFGSVVRDALMPAEWPDAVALDETSFDLTITETDDQDQKVSHPASVSILGVYGYFPPGGAADERSVSPLVVVRTGLSGRPSFGLGRANRLGSSATRARRSWRR